MIPGNKAIISNGIGAKSITPTAGNLSFLIKGIASKSVAPVAGDRVPAYPDGKGGYIVFKSVSAGNIFVVDSTDTISEFLRDFTANGGFGSTGTGDGQFNTPSQIWCDSSNNLYVADYNNNRVQKFDSTGSYLLKFGSNGSGDGQFLKCPGVCVDSAGNIFVSDEGNSRIQKFDSTGTYVSQFGSHGESDGQFVKPMGICVDSNDNLYVCDVLTSHSLDGRLHKFNSSGTFQWKVALTGCVAGPYGCHCDLSDNVLVADPWNDQIKKYDSSGTLLSSFGSTGSGDGQFTGAIGVWVDIEGNIYVADKDNDRVQKFNSSGTYMGQFGDYTVFTDPANICVLRG
jgi:sugar lactone lactonase YvrE